MSDERDTLKRIELKLEQLVQLTKIANSEKLQSYRQGLASDAESTKILELSEQPISYKNLVTQVMTATGSSERTVQSRISKLRADGLLTANREGGEVYYVNAGLLD